MDTQECAEQQQLAHGPPSLPDPADISLPDSTFLSVPNSSFATCKDGFESFHSCISDSSDGPYDQSDLENTVVASTPNKTRSCTSHVHDPIESAESLAQMQPNESSVDIIKSSPEILKQAHLVSERSSCDPTLEVLKTESSIDVLEDSSEESLAPKKISGMCPREDSSTDILPSSSSINVIGSSENLPDHAAKTWNSLSNDTTVSIRSSVSSIAILGTSSQSQDYTLPCSLQEGPDLAEDDTFGEAPESTALADDDEMSGPGVLDACQEVMTTSMETVGTEVSQEARSLETIVSPTIPSVIRSHAQAMSPVRSEEVSNPDLNKNLEENFKESSSQALHINSKDSNGAKLIKDSSPLAALSNSQIEINSTPAPSVLADQDLDGSTEEPESYLKLNNGYALLTPALKDSRQMNDQVLKELEQTNATTSENSESTFVPPVKETKKTTIVPSEESQQTSADSEETEQSKVPAAEEPELIKSSDFDESGQTNTPTFAETDQTTASVLEKTEQQTEKQATSLVVEESKQYTSALEESMRSYNSPVERAEPALGGTEETADLTHDDMKQNANFSPESSRKPEIARNMYPEVVIKPSLQIAEGDIEVLKVMEPVEYSSSVESTPSSELPPSLTSREHKTSETFGDLSFESELTTRTEDTVIPCQTERSSSVISGISVPDTINISREHPASDLLVSRLAGVLPKDDVVYITTKQKYMLNKLECTNEKLRSCNQLSAAQYEKAAQNFKHYTRLLVEMRRDVEVAFKRIHSIKGKLAATYPAIYDRINREVHTGYTHPDEEDLLDETVKLVDSSNAQTSKDNSTKTYIIKDDDISEVK